MVAGQLVALRERRSFDIALLGWRGQPERVAHDSWLIGTALSGPVLMHSIQAAATVRLWAGPSRAATRILGSLGAIMACASLLEREVRGALSPAGRNRTTTPIAAAGLTLALAMAVLGLREQDSGWGARRRRPHMPLCRRGSLVRRRLLP
jgi:hypothetical protein